MALRGDGRYAVGGVPGLYLRIEGNSRSWVFRHQSKGKRQEFGLGSYPEVSLAQARDRAWERRLYRNALLVNPPQAQVSIQPPELPPNRPAGSRPSTPSSGHRVLTSTPIR